MEEPRVHFRHVRKAKLCARGARAWFRQRGLDYAAFVADGLPVSEIEALNDALGNRVAAIARQEATHGG